MNENVNITVCTNVCMYKNIMYMTYVYMFRLNHQRRVLENELSCAHGKYLEIHKEQLKANLCKKLRYKTNIILYFFFISHPRCDPGVVLRKNSGNMEGADSLSKVSLIMATGER